MKAATVHSDSPDAEGLTLRKLSSKDAGRGYALSTEIGWNQVEADWRYMLENGSGIGMADGNGRLVASAIALPYGAFGWVCMVLVAPDWRRRGIATDLMNRVIAGLEADGTLPGLDATPAGREVYRQLGFVDICPLERLIAPEAKPDAPSPDGIDIRPLEAADMAAVVRYDAALFGGDRAALLAHLRERQPPRASAAWQNGDLAGYALAREGRTWTQIGPVVADSEAIARALIAAAVQAGTGSRDILIDAMTAHPGLLDWLKAAGFTFQRPYIRMIRGSTERPDRPAAIYAPAGPELG